MVLSREVEKDSDFILVCQPVRGLDIGAINYIHEILLELRNQGKAILMISAELTDIFQLCDRIAVMYKGEVMALGKNEELILYSAFHPPHAHHIFPLIFLLSQIMS